MPYYGNNLAAVPSGITMYSGVVPTYASAPGVGYTVLATCPTGRAWEVKTVWMQNNHITRNYLVGLNRVPAGWIGSAGDPLLRVFLNIRLIPGELVMFSETIGLRPGDRLFGYQYEVDTGGATADVNMHIDGLETRI